MSKLVSNLNQLLADLNVLYRKVQNYHWNIKGKEFFQLHAKLEEYYDYINEQVDEVAEKILMIGGQPLGRLKDYLEISKIQEAENVKISAADVLDSIEKDFKYIKDEIKDDEFVESIKYFTYRDEPTPSVAYVQVAKIIKE